MKKLIKILTTIIVLVIIISLSGICDFNVIMASSRVSEGQPVKVGVLLNRLKIDYMPEVRKNLEEIQKANEGKVEFDFYYAEENQSTQNYQLDKLLKEGIDLILLNIVDVDAAQDSINKIKEYNVPVILFNREPVKIDAIKSYNKSYYVGTNSEEAGRFQGKILVDEWNANKKVMDINGDNILQYVMLKGERENIEAIGRTKYSVESINNAGIKTEELATRICNWDKELARQAMESLFLKYGNNIEAVIANNDGMAVGAIEALQKYGYNKGDKSKTIPVVGIDATEEAKELIKKGFMAGSVIQDAKATAEALYTIGMNLVNNTNPLEGTNYKFDETGIAIRIPHKPYINQI